MSRLRLYLTLGRVSNLPTIWSNCLAGAALALGVAPPPALLAWTVLAASCFYTAGMFLNDAFDAEHDRRKRPERPIPRGLIGTGHVFLVGGALLVAGEALLYWIDWRAAGVGLVLGYLIVHYSMFHKGDPLSPLVMALCRGCVYLLAAGAVGVDSLATVLAGAGVLTAYVIVLSQVAKRDLLPGRGIAYLIAGISLVDGAMVLWATGQWDLAALAASGFPLTLALQRFAPGT